MSASLTVYWEGFCERLRANLNRESYDAWFKDLALLDWQGSSLRLSVPNRYVKQWIESHYQREVLAAARAVVPETRAVELSVPEARPQTAGAAGVSRVPTAGSVLEQVPPLAAVLSAPRSQGVPHATPIATAAAFPLEQFVVGGSNRLAHAACRSVLEQPAPLYNPLLLQGDHGLGKTHLLQGLAHALQKRHPHLRVRSVSCEEFANAYLYALAERKLEAFRNEYRRCQALFVDDVHFLAGKEKTQDEFLHTFDSLKQLGRQIVLSSDVHPREIKRLDARLVARFQSGLVARLAPPDFEMRVELLRAKARSRGLDLAPALAELICARVERNVRELEGVACKIAALAAAEARAVDKELVLLALRELGYLREGPLTLDEILDFVSLRYMQAPDEIRSGKRHAGLVRSRHLAMYLSKHLTSFSLSEIGRFFGNRDHSTVLHALRKIEAEQKSDTALHAEIQSLRRGLGR